jgi:hypothetical protein
MPSEIGMRGARPCPEGNCGGNTRPAAEGERTLMGPAAQRSRRPQSAYPPMRVQVLKRTNGRKVGKLVDDPAGAEDESRVTPGQSNDMSETSGTGLAPVGSPPRGVQPASSTAGAWDRATRAAFAQANRCTQTRRTGEGDTA